MRDNGRKSNQHIEETEDDFFVYESEAVRARFLHMLSEDIDAELSRAEENIERPPATKRHKIRINRLFRERVGGTFLPFPEADNLYERTRSKMVVKLKINEFRNKRKKRR